MNHFSSNNKNNGGDEFKPKKSKVRHPGMSIIPLLAAFVIIVAALVIWVVLYLGTVAPPDVSSGNPHSKVFTTVETAEPPLSSGAVEPPETEPSTTENPVKNEENEPPVVTPTKKTEFYNILVCGRDYLGWTTDVMMVISFDVPNNKVNVLQIPRDSYVIDTNETSGEYERRINAVFSAGVARAKSDKIVAGMLSAEKVVEDTFGISIDRYVYVDLAGFEKIIDALGGVELTVPRDLKYEDPGQNLYINLKAGYQTLNGDQALQFVRFRDDYAEGDLGRVDAQKIFLSALVKKVLTPSTVKKLPVLLKEIYQYMVTSLSTDDCTYFIKNGVKLSTSDIFIYTAPGQYYVRPNGAVYYSLYTAENLTIINNAFNCMTADISLKNMNMRTPARTAEYDRISTAGKSVADLLKNPPSIIFTN